MVVVVTRCCPAVRRVAALLAAAAVHSAPAAPSLPAASATSLPMPPPVPPLMPPVAAPRAGESFADPMRPPNGVPVSAAAAGAGRAAPARAEGSRAPRLQSVLLGEAGAQAAVINGSVLAVGDRFGDARLLRLTERSAVLVGPNGQTTTLLLTPGVDKHDAGTLSHGAAEAAPAPARAPGRRPASAFARRATEETTP